ncbi:MAG: GAF domain-containing sensor histidine kinase [Leptolyngbyaceae cyanobacterium SM1_3_5]|nr:GAF domain-containing sensor histidine kinase [Leptolyngbyaceae cyanobacterium SM1_3_5]
MPIKAMDEFDFSMKQQQFYKQIQALNASLEQQVQEQTAELRRSLVLARVLKQITDEIRSSLNPQTVLQTIVDEVRSLFDTDRVVMYRFDQDWVGEVIVESVLEPWRRVLGNTYQDNCFPEESGQQYLEGRVRAVDDVEASDVAECHKGLLRSMQVKANLVVPIRMLGQVWGLLIAHECRAPRHWEEFEIDLLQQLADQAAIAIQQAELYEQSCVAAATARAQARQLEQTADELAQALQDLQQAQGQLVQTEKMSSLGQLVAGVAHEINNPVSFIYGNLSHATSYAHDLFAVIAAYQAECPQPSDRTQAVLDTVDLDFIKEDFPKILGSMKVGSERIRQIVLSLQNFSRADQAQKKLANIHEGIDNTLMILQHRLKPNGADAGIEIIKTYGDLPLVDCFAGQLNQVFMNLISNAIDALEERVACELITAGQQLETRPNQITIQTSIASESTIQIRIADNGLGITEEIRSHLFDPFFTTKPVGKGTGLGLAISYQIIERHGGTITCNSQWGKGTEFCIELPVHRQRCESTLKPH